MHPQGYSPGPASPEAVNGRQLRLPLRVARHRKLRVWVHALLFLLTLLTTTVVGARMAESFLADRPAVDLGQDLFSYVNILSEPQRLLRGLPFSLVLLAILLAHEMGHYLACVYYRLDASLPYFLPSPTLIGTLGAFIRIRAPIYSKRVLFDIGIAGPVTGFVVLLPALTIGLAHSRIVPGIAQQGDLIFGTPVVFRLFEWLIFPGTPSSDISLHPVARAAWVGVFATALNLLPIGQLDGGHILYAFVGERHRLLSRIFTAALVPMGLIQYRGGQFLIPGYWPWIVWAIILFLFGLRHPMIYDRADLGPARKKLGLLALVLFLLSFMLAPIETAPGP